MDLPWDPITPSFPFVVGDKRPLFYNPKPNSTVSQVPMWDGPWKYPEGARKRQRVEEEVIEDEKPQTEKAAEQTTKKSEKKEEQEQNDKNGPEELYRSYLALLHLPNRNFDTAPATYPPTYQEFVIQQNSASNDKKRQRPADENEDFSARKVRVTQDLKRNNNSSKYRLTDSIGDGVTEWISHTLAPLVTTYGARSLDSLSDSTLYRLPRWCLEFVLGKYMQARHTHKRREHIRSILHSGAGVGDARPHCKHMGAKQRAQQDRHAILLRRGSVDVPEVPGDWAGSKGEEEWASTTMADIKERMWYEFNKREVWRKMDARADAVERKKREEKRARYQPYVANEDDENKDVYEEDIHVRLRRRTQGKQQPATTADRDSTDDELFEVGIDSAPQDDLHPSAILEIRDSKGEKKVLRKHSNMPLKMLMQDGPMVIDDEGEGTVFRDPLTKELIDFDEESVIGSAIASSPSSSNADDSDTADRRGSDPSDESDSSSPDSDDGIPMPWDKPKKLNGVNKGKDASSNFGSEDLSLPPPPVSTVLLPHLVPARVPKSTLPLRKQSQRAASSTTAEELTSPRTPKSEKPSEPSESWKRLLAHLKRFGLKPHASSHKEEASTTTSSGSPKATTVSQGALSTPNKPTEPLNTPNKPSKSSRIPSPAKPSTPRPDITRITITRPGSTTSTSSQDPQSGSGPKDPSKPGPTGFVLKTPSQETTSSGQRNQEQAEPSSQATHADSHNAAPPVEPPLDAPLTTLINGGLSLFGRGLSKLVGTASQAPSGTASQSSSSTAIPGLGYSVLGAKKSAGDSLWSTQGEKPEEPSLPDYEDDLFDDNDDDERVICPECTFANEPGAKWCSSCDAPFEELLSNAPAPQSLANKVQVEEYSDDEDGLVTYIYDAPIGDREPEFEMTGGAGPAGTHDESGQPIPISPEEKARLLKERRANVATDQHRAAYSARRGVLNRLQLPYYHDPGTSDDNQHQSGAQRGHVLRTKTVRRAMIRLSTQEREANQLHFIENIRKARAMVQGIGLRFPEDMPRWHELSKNEQKRVRRAIAALDEQAALENEAYVAKCKKKREEYRKREKRFPEDLPSWDEASAEIQARCWEAVRVLEAQDAELENITQEDWDRLVRDLAWLRYDAGDAFLRCFKWDEYTEAECELIELAIFEIEARDEARRNDMEA
ncbi:hypothetical protein FB567DRAFT_634015, partial [Paraphoma chrysanthemicola]